MLMLALLAVTAEPELQVRASAAFVHLVFCAPCPRPRLCPSTLHSLLAARGQRP